MGVVMLLLMLHKLEVIVVMYKQSPVFLSPLLFAVVVGVITLI